MEMLVRVWVIQCTRSGNFLARDLSMVQSLKCAGRLYDAQEALDTARTNFLDDYEIHSFYEVDA